MLTAVEVEHDQWFTEWRRLELARVDAAGMSYLDYGGAGLYPASLVRADLERLAGAVLGNPHSEHRASRDATRDVEAARAAILAFVNADPLEYGVVLTTNATAACRLVGEAYPFAAAAPLVLSADNHNSVHGLREFARARGASVAMIPLDDELRLAAPIEVLAREGRAGGLFAFPAQSNFSGVRHPLGLIEIARQLGLRVLLDAAAWLPTTPLDLRAIHPDFVVLSLYKIAGYPSGIGALVARHEALKALQRPWFAGGTVDWVSVGGNRHKLREGVCAFEDGTPPFLAAGAVSPGLGLVRDVQPRLRPHLSALTALLLEGLVVLEHPSGKPLVTVHGPTSNANRGATVAFTLRDDAGEVIPFWDVEVAARETGIALRGGCFCNPGCSEFAFGFPADAAERFASMGSGFTPARAAASLGGGPVGALRISLGLGSVRRDIERVLEFLGGYLGR